MTDARTKAVHRQYWRSLEALADPDRASHDEFPPPPKDLTQLRRPAAATPTKPTTMARRTFGALMGSSLALAGGACVRKPVEKIMPYTARPEDTIPGRPMHYATVANVAGTVLGLIVESHDGRPTKIDGNPNHPMSMGGTSARAQAEILALYDPDRSGTSSIDAEAKTTVDVANFLTEHAKELEASGGAGLAVLTEWIPSPTYQALLRALKGAYPEVQIYTHDAARPSNADAGAAMLGAAGWRTFYTLEEAKVIVALDADILNCEGDAVRHANHFASGRRLTSPSDPMNRLYVAEAQFSATGAVADARLRIRSSKLATLLAGLAAKLAERGVEIPTTVRLAGTLDAEAAAWVQNLASDLLAHRGRSAIIVGESQPPHVHALALAINQSLGNVGAGVYFSPTAEVETQGLAELVAAARDGAIGTLLIVGGNPVYDAPADLGVASAIAGIATSIHLSHYANETSQLTQWHIARSHFLEAWGDLQARDGTTSVQQPLIATLWDTLSEIEVLALLVHREPRSGHDLVRAQWGRLEQPATADASATAGEPADAKKADAKEPPKPAGDAPPPLDKIWRRWLHEGIIQKADPLPPDPPALDWGGLADGWKDAPTEDNAADAPEVLFVLATGPYDGRYANIPWLQELPDPMTKLTWDNAACMSKSMAASLEVANGDLVRLTRDGQAVEVPAFILPGTAEGVVVVARGYGRKGTESVAYGVGTDVNAVRHSAEPSFSSAVAVEKARGTRALSSTQEHSMIPEGRGLVRGATLREYREDPKFAQVVEGPPLKSLFEEPHPRGGHQWGMSIDLGACTGCNACVIACQAENNIPTVGKDRIREGREMHWIRIDRYFTGSESQPGAIFHPMLCQHCENAPCETVCPVAATAHSPEGLNDMAYNRCIGTRYCSNNCPYKVRRFNFFNYNLDIEPTVQMQRNPDVTVRFRGVMEKCTFCVQRIQGAKIASKRAGTDEIRDGTLTSACAQACPAKAIVFGDLNDPTSQVVKRKRSNRDYTVLAELNNHPRVTYLARVRNPKQERS